MKRFGILAAAALGLALAPAPSCADSPVARLDGTWVEAVQIKDSPRSVLHFKGRKVRLENVFGEPSLELDCRFKEEQGGKFTVSFQWRHKVTRGNGRVVEHTEGMDLLYHEEDGRPILSEQVIELDGRGLVIFSEFLRKEDFADGFTSKLRQKLNSRKAPPTCIEN